MKCQPKTSFLMTLGVVTIALTTGRAYAQCDEQKLTESFSVDPDYGSAVDISGDRMIVGAPSQGVANEPRVFIYHRDGSQWVK